MILVTSPNGLFIVTKIGEVILFNRENCFGIDSIKGENGLDTYIYVAYRQKKGTKLVELKYHLEDGAFEYCGDYSTTWIEDVHQIAVQKNSFVTTILLTNTKYNNVRVVKKDRFNFEFKMVGFKKDNQDADINHINATHIEYKYSDVSDIYIGLNNKGIKESQVLKVHDDSRSELITLDGVYHSHDLEPYKGDILISASHQGFVYSLNEKRPLFNTGDVWTRGLCVSPEGVWVGYSAVSPRTSRQDPNLKNSINLFSHDTFKLLRSIEIPNAGQINDMIYIKDASSNN